VAGAGSPWGHLPSGHLPDEREAKDWATTIEAQAHHIAAGGFAPVPKGVTLADLIEKYRETHSRTPGKTKDATLTMLSRDLGKVKLSSLRRGAARFH